MVKILFMRIISVVASALIMIGVLLMIWMLATEEDRNNIEVYLSDGKTQIIEFDDISLVPGEQCEYNVMLKSDNAEQYELTLDFIETEERTLKNFARVKIFANGEVICDELLASIFEGEKITLSVDFTEGRNTDLKIVYYLPIDVGNEAKNSEAIFELVLEASNEGGSLWKNQR